MVKDTQSRREKKDKAPRIPSSYNEFMKEMITIVKERMNAYGFDDHKIAFMIAAACWKLYNPNQWNVFCDVSELPYHDGLSSSDRDCMIDYTLRTKYCEITPLDEMICKRF